MTQVYVSGVGTVDSDGHVWTGSGWVGTNTLTPAQIAQVGAAFQSSGAGFTGPGGQVYPAPSSTTNTTTTPPGIDAIIKSITDTLKGITTLPKDLTTKDNTKSTEDKTTLPSTIPIIGELSLQNPKALAAGAILLYLAIGGGGKRFKF